MSAPLIADDAAAIAQAMKDLGLETSVPTETIADLPADLTSIAVPTEEWDIYGELWIGC